MCLIYSSNTSIYSFQSLSIYVCVYVSNLLLPLSSTCIVIELSMKKNATIACRYFHPFKAYHRVSMYCLSIYSNNLYLFLYLYLSIRIITLSITLSIYISINLSIYLWRWTIHPYIKVNATTATSTCSWSRCRSTACSSSPARSPTSSSYPRSMKEIR